MFAGLIRHRATVYLMVVCVLVFGLLTYRALPREAQPDVDIPFVMVTTVYTGVSPLDVESLLTVPLENELAGVKDLKKMTSTSAEGVSMVALEFEPEVDIEDVLQKVRDRVSRAESKLPQEAEDTEIREISMTDWPIMIITIAGPVDEVLLKEVGERLEEEITRVPGVLEAKVSGGRTRQIRVQIDPKRLQHYGLSLNDVIGAIAAENVNIPGGNVRADQANFLLRVPGEFKDPKEIEAVAVKRIGDRPVFVRDLGTVLDSFTDRDTYARMNGQPAVSIAVTKRSGANILQVAETTKKIVAQQAETWPQGVTWRVLGDQSRFIRDIVKELEANIVTALILVVGILMFFLGFRNSLFVAVAIPLSMLLGMIIIWAAGMTLNMVVLFSLILVLGMLVDNAIVLVENIYRHLEEGKSLFQASVDGAGEVALAVTSSTLTTIAAFVPLMFWSGIMGEFMGFLPKTVVIVLGSSLAVALCMTPVFTSALMRQRPGATRSFRESRVMRAYRAFLEWCLRHRLVTSAAMLATLVGTVMLYGVFNHGTEFFPTSQPDRATITVRASDGTDVEATDRIVRRVEAILAAEENVEVFVAETGVAGGNELVGAQSSPNQARITLDFLPHETKAGPGEQARTEDTRRTVDRLRTQLAEIPGAEIIIQKEAMGPPVGAPVALEVSGDDFHQVGELTARVRRDLAKIRGVTELKDNFRVGRPEMRLEIDRGAAKRVGASTQVVAGTVRTAVAGSIASKLRDGEDEYDILVELAPRYKNDLQSILGLRIPGREDTSPDTFSVPLSAVASYELIGGSGAIHHIDQDLVATIEGNIAEGFNENEVRARVSQYVASAELEPGFGLRLGGADDEQRKSEEFLSRAFLVCIFLIALVLVTQFNRYDLPFIILCSVVLSMVGVLWGLMLTGTPFGVIMTGVGVISLAGVVVNNAIVLLDYIEQLRSRGLKLSEALVEAGVTRFRPVLLTAITTILGLVPMALGVSIDFAELRVLIGGRSADFWGPMAVAVIFGLAFATVLTLVMVPLMYSMTDSARSWLRRVWHRLRGPRPAAGA